MEALYSFNLLPMYLHVSSSTFNHKSQAFVPVLTNSYHELKQSHATETSYNFTCALLKLPDSSDNS